MSLRAFAERMKTSLIQWAARIWLPVALTAIVGACAESPFDAEPRPRLDVLFIGNSYTFYNDMPKMLEQVAVDAGNGRTITTTMSVQGGASLQNHWLRGLAADSIAKGGWDYVVLQQGPTSLAIDRDTLILAVRGFDRLIRAAGAKTVVYMVWPSKDRFQYFDDVQRSYRAAADSVGALLVPAGDAWRAAWRMDANLALYDVDDFHPSVLGSYLAALTFYECLTGRDARHIPNASARETTIKVLENAAHEAAAACGRQEQNADK
jgi:hypothetical protein